MTFEEADRQYQHLLSQYQAGQIGQPGFLQALDSLQIQAADGSWWRIRPHDGQWLRWDGANWVATTPPHRVPHSMPPPMASSVPATPADAPQKRGRRWWLTCSVVLLLAVCCLRVGG